MAYIVVLVTAKDGEEAKAISQALLQKKLIACANIVKDIQSFYWWEGEIDNGQESLLVMKTKKVLLAKVIKAVKAAHSYSCPEVIALPIAGGNKDYLKWIDESLRKKG